MDLETLGITKEDLRDRIVEKAVEEMWNEDGFHDVIERGVRDTIQGAVDSAVAKIGEEKVLPTVAALVEGAVLQPTNRWGEKQGDPMTFVEYLTDRAEKWLMEEVDYNGKVRGQDSFGWRKRGTRAAFMVDEHLHYTIKNTVEKAFSDFNAKLATSLLETVKIQLNEALGKVRITTKVR